MFPILSLPFRLALATVAPMDAIVIAPLTEADPALLARREALGLDRFDEVWDGVLHMVPSPSMEHQRINYALTVTLGPLAEAAGLVPAFEANLVPPDEPGWNDYRVPDLMVFRPEVATERAVEGQPELVIEIRSPGDDSFAKLPFYERIGTREVLIIDRDTKLVRRWLNGADGLVEVLADDDGCHTLLTLPASLRSGSGHLIIESQGSSTTV